MFTSLILSISAWAATSICSFNIQFLGLYKNRDNDGLAELLRAQGCSIVVVQELVAPPSDEFLALNPLFSFPENPAFSTDGLRFSYPLREGKNTPIRESLSSTAFFSAMRNVGFGGFMLSEEDTGPKKNRNNGSASEWWVSFFDPEVVEPAEDLPHGFLEEKLVSNSHFDRVPYAFPFRFRKTGFDFVAISVHMRPNNSVADREKRQIEFFEIENWVRNMSQDRVSRERDYLVMGDTNIQSKSELDAIMRDSQAFISLNSQAKSTNTAVASPKPYDQVFLNPKFTTDQEVSSVDNFEVISLSDQMANRWKKRYPEAQYPGDAKHYQHDRFRTEYSDHNPIRFSVHAESDDD